MGGRKGIGTKILNYVYVLILILFLIIVIGFNLAVRAFAVDRLKNQLQVTTAAVENFDTTVKVPKGSGRRSMMENMLRLDLGSSDVNIMFLTEDKELSMDIVEAGTVINQGTGMGSMGMGSMGSGGMMGSGSGRGPQKSGGQGNQTPAATTTPATVPETIDEYSMVLGKADYDKSMKVLSYVKASEKSLTAFDYTKENIDGESYYLKSIPFSGEYILSFIPVKVYDSFISNTLKILFVILAVTLILTWFIVKYLANQIAKPIKQLESLSRRIGSGDFAGESYNFMEEELYGLNQSLNESAAKLKDLQDNRNIFFQNVSHELRTPLTSIMGYAEGIKYGVFEGKEAGEVILKESEKLEKLVEDILYLSRIESTDTGHSRKNQVKLSDILLESASNLANEAAVENKKINCSYEEDPTLYLNSEELVRAISNLLSNGLRYAKNTVTLLGKIVDNNLLIEVSDDGPGIEPEVMGNLFERFSKGKSGKHGIGLSITKATAEKCGGTVKAQNTGNGAKFIISIPMDRITKK